MIKHIAYFTLCLGILAVTGSKGQAQTTSERPSTPLQVNQDPRLDDIIAKRIEFNKRLAVSSQGYRILIYSGKQRQAAYSAQGLFKRAYPEQETYLTYAFPNFRVTAGDYKNKEDASRMLTELERLLNDQSLLIVPQKIDLTKVIDQDAQ